MENNLQALNLVKNWTKELEDKIEKALGNRPLPEIDFMHIKGFIPRKPRRDIAISFEKE